VVGIIGIVVGICIIVVGILRHWFPSK
jgi:hypothetical protein